MKVRIPSLLVWPMARGGGSHETLPPQKGREAFPRVVSRRMARVSGLGTAQQRAFGSTDAVDSFPDLHAIL
jgi:hypothetical protein